MRERADSLLVTHTHTNTHTHRFYEGHAVGERADSFVLGWPHSRVGVYRGVELVLQEMGMRDVGGIRRFMYRIVMKSNKDRLQ